MAGRQVTGAERAQWRLLDPAAFLRARAARMKAAAPRRVGRGRQIAAQDGAPSALAARRIRYRHRH